MPLYIIGDGGAGLVLWRVVKVPATPLRQSVALALMDGHTLSDYLHRTS